MKERKTRLQAELDRRAKLLQEKDERGYDLCQDDVAWATMTGEYMPERALYQGYEEQGDE